MRNKQKSMNYRMTKLVIISSVYFILLLGGIFLYGWQSGYAETVYIIIISIVFPDLIGLVLIPTQDTHKEEKPRYVSRFQMR